jgi:hypothetical protein
MRNAETGEQASQPGRSGAGMSGMGRFEPKNPDYRTIATDTFERQRAMRTLGISIARLEPGEVDLAMAYSASCMPGSSRRGSTAPAASPPSR